MPATEEAAEAEACAVSARRLSSTPLRPAPPQAHRHLDGLAFGFLGFGVSWTLADSIATNTASFMRCLPGGLYLPDQIGLSAAVSQAVCLTAWWLYVRLRGTPSFVGYCRLVWACLAVEVGGVNLLAPRFEDAFVPAIVARIVFAAGVWRGRADRIHHNVCATGSFRLFVANATESWAVSTHSRSSTH